MKLIKLFIVALFASTVFISCNNASDNTEGKEEIDSVDVTTENTSVDNKISTSEDIDTNPRIEVILGSWKSDTGESIVITNNKIKVEGVESTFEMYDKCKKDKGVASKEGNFIVFKKGDVDCCYEVVFEGGGDLEMRLYEGETSREAMFSKQ